MNELILAIKEWPAIIQGALGSALFAMIILAGQWVWKKCANSYSYHTKNARESWLIGQMFKYEACIADSGLATIEAMLWILYRASRNLVKALLWLVFGLMMNSVLSLAGMVAYTVCIWYLFRTFQIVGPIKDAENANEQLEKIRSELEKLENSST